MVVAVAVVWTSFIGGLGGSSSSSSSQLVSSLPMDRWRMNVGGGSDDGRDDSDDCGAPFLGSGIGANAMLDCEVGR